MEITVNNVNYYINIGLASVYGYDNTIKTIIIPPKIEHEGKSYTVFYIINNAFYKTVIESVTIPNTIVTIESDAFTLSQLKTFIIPNDSNLRTIADHAFDNTSPTMKLSSFFIPKTVNYIGERAFYRVPLETLTIESGENLVTIGTQAFMETSIEDLVLPNSVTYIGSSCFEYTPLKSLTIENGENLVTIGSSAFKNTLLEEITIPKSVTSISSAFYNCSFLRSVTIQGKTTINNAFSPTVKNYCIQGDINDYKASLPSYEVLFYNNQYTPNKKLIRTVIPFNPNPTVAYNNSTNSIEIDLVCDNQAPITLIGSFKDDTIVSYFTTSVSLPLTLPANKTYTDNFTITYDNLTIVSIPLTFTIPVTSVKLNTSDTSKWTNKELQQLESILKKTLSNKLIPVQKPPASVFSNVSAQYSDITTMYAVPYQPNLDISKYAFDKKTLLLLPTKPVAINIGGSLSSDGVHSYMNGKVWELGTPKMIRNHRVTLVANGSSGITIEYIPTSPICFPAGTPVLTDQGYIPIDKITTQTLGKKPIQITKTITKDNYLVCFEKDALEKNVPFQRTYMTKNHKVYYKEWSLRAKDMIPYFDKVYKVPYTGEVLYNVLVDVHRRMKVNNMVCETLDPKNRIAQLARLTKEEQEDKINLWKTQEKGKKQMIFHK